MKSFFKKYWWAALVVILLAIFIAPHFMVEAQTQTPSLTRNNSWRGTNWFNKATHFVGPVTSKQHKWTLTSSGVTYLNWEYSMGNTLIVDSGLTIAWVYLPAITKEMSGYRLTVMNEGGTSGSTIVYVISSVTPTDYIEATAGTLSGTSDINIDARGDSSTWEAIHYDNLSGTTRNSVWKLVADSIT